MAPKKMRTATSIANFVWVLALCAFSTAQGTKTSPAATLNLPALLAPGSATVDLRTLAFLTDNSLAVAGCNEQKQCKLVALRFEDGKLEPAAETNNFNAYASIHRSGGGILANRNGDNHHSAVLYSPDLKNTEVISGTISFDSQISSTGSTFGQSLGDVWTIYETSSPTTPRRSGRGSLLGVSDNAAVYQWGKQVKIETMDGDTLGSFAAKLSSKCRTTAQIIDQARLLVTNCSGGARITDFNGKTLLPLTKQEGWSTRSGISSDGNRLLYDTYTRRTSLGQKTREAAIGVASLGLGIGDEQSNGEFVHVIDTVSGKSCFDWSAPLKPEEAGRYHADISPSGREVAIVTGTTLLLYELPAECSGQ